MKPDWKSAPKWANYLAMDADGRWCWHASEPETGIAIWNGWDRAIFSGNISEKSNNWTKSLEKRPNMK